MRMTRFLPLLAVAAVLVPLHAVAGTTSGPQLKLSPASGPPGSHFTATFTFSVTRCDLYTVGFWWDDPHYTSPLGGGADSSSGQFCQVSIDAVVPSADANPGTTYPVHAYSNPRGSSVDGGPGPSGAAGFAVTGAQSAGSGGAPTTASASASAQAAPTGGTGARTGVVAPLPSSAAGQPASAALAPASGGAAPASSPAPDATQHRSTGSGPPLIVPTEPAGPAGWIAASAAAAVLLVALLAWAYRSGRLRFLVRR